MRIPNIGNRHLIYSNIDFLALLGIILIPFDALRIFPLPMTYRPIGCLFLCLYFFLVFSYTKKYKKSRFIFFSVCILMIFVSFLLFFLQNRRIISFAKYLITILFGFCSFMGLVHYFRKIAKKENNPIDCISYLYVLSMQLPILLGVLQLFQILTHTQIFTPFFNTINVRFTPGRICISSAEPASAAGYLLLYLIITINNRIYIGRKWFINKIIAFLLFIATFSMKGYLLFFVFFLLYKGCYLRIKNIVPLICIFIISFYGIKLICNLNGYLQSRFQFLEKFITAIFSDKKTVLKILTTSDSAFIRIGNPLIGLMMFKDNFFIGAGGGYFYRTYPYYVTKFFPEAINMLEVNAAINAGYEITARNLFVRLFAENGVFIGCLFIGYIINILRKIRNMHFLTKLFTFCVSYLLFQDSLCDQIFIYIFALCTLVVEEDIGQNICCDSNI